MKIRIKPIKLNDVGKFILTSAILLLGILISYNTLDLANKVEIKMIVPFLYALFLFALSKQRNKRIDSKIARAVSIFFICVGVASIMQFDYGNLVASILGIITFYAISCTENIITEKFYSIFNWSLLLVVGIVILQYGILSLNSQGVIITFAGIIFLNWFCIKKLNKQIIWGLCVVVVVLLIAITRSRTSMAAFLLVAAISYVYLFMRKITVKNLVVLLLCLVAFGIFADELMTYFVNIFFNKWQNSDLTSNRISIWARVIENVSFFGNGVEHLGYTNIFVSDAHNSLLQILGCFGVISFISFLWLIIAIVRKITKIENKIVYINFFVGWFFISMFESLELFTTRVVVVSTLFILHVSMLSRENVRWGSNGR